MTLLCSGELESDRPACHVNLGERQLSNPSLSRVSSPVRQIVLVEPVRYTDEILPVCLPGPLRLLPWQPHVLGHQLQDNSLCSWALPEVQIQLVGTAACNTLYNIDPDPNIGRDPVKPDVICAGYAKRQRGSCQGDSGGPLACYCNGTWFLMGIVSCGDVYVQIVAYGEWIWGHMVSGGQATTMENSTSGINDARPSFSTYMLLFTTLLMSL
ncbi:unnamed protein product [Natator depressus]